MPALTTTEVIEKGDYLKPDFDPSTLTRQQLLGLFGHHNIDYPTQATKKPELVKLFVEKIQSHANLYTRQRLKRENSQASDDGITDGVTGRPLNEVRAIRRSRRISKTPAPEEPPPPKRRRASAEPSLGGPSRRKTIRPAQPALIEESEPEEPVVRKVSRPKKTVADAATQARRAPRPVTDDPESGWEENNVFQSGAESSSPVRPSPVRPRARKSSVPRPTHRSRKSLSAPPQVSPQVSPSPPKNTGKAPSHIDSRLPQSKFEPELPPFPTRQLSVVRDLKEEDDDGDDRQSDTDQSQQIPSLFESMAEAGVEVPTQLELEEDGLADDQVSIDDYENVNDVAQRIADGGKLVNRKTSPATSGLHSIFRAVFILMVISCSGLLYQYKRESAQIGFCDAGTSTNAVLDELRIRRAAIESCNRENRTTLWLTPDSDPTVSVPPPAPTATAHTTDDDQSSSMVVTVESCPPPPLIPYVEPNECTPCPSHATCTPSSITCENGFILRPQPLLAFLSVPNAQKGNAQIYVRPSYASSGSDMTQTIYAVISYLLDGMPFVGPVAVPPRCVEDPQRKRNIGALGRSLDSLLANERGRRLCEGVGVDVPPGDEVSEAQRWGMDVEKLREHTRGKTASHLMSIFDDTFNEAVQQLLQWGGVFMAEDASGTRYLAHKTPMMGWDCALRVKARESWKEWRFSIFSTLAGALSIYFIRGRQARKAIEREQVASLVTVALDWLRNQEYNHRINPTLEPRPYLSSLQLRDLVLQDIHDISKRKRLWLQVERVVESNANVQTSQQEVEGGDEQRVWEWVGRSGPTMTPMLDFKERGRPVA